MLSEILRVNLKMEIASS